MFSTIPPLSTFLHFRCYQQAPLCSPCRLVLLGLTLLLSPQTTVPADVRVGLCWIHMLRFYFTIVDGYRKTARTVQRVPGHPGPVSLRNVNIEVSAVHLSQLMNQRWRLMTS